MNPDRITLGFLHRQDCQDNEFCFCILTVLADCFLQWPGSAKQHYKDWNTFTKLETKVGNFAFCKNILENIFYTTIKHNYMGKKLLLRTKQINILENYLTRHKTLLPVPKQIYKRSILRGKELYHIPVMCESGW